MSTAQSTTILDKIRQRGHSLVVIRPATFEGPRISHEDLFPLISRNSVQLRGWDYPHIDALNRPRWGGHWVEQDIDYGHRIEVWRFHTNGLFVHYFAMPTDWRDQPDLSPADSQWSPGQELYFSDTIHLFVEIYEFAARLAQSPAGSGQMHVDVSIKRLPGRQLVLSTGPFPPEGHHVTQMNEWTESWDGIANRIDRQSA